MEIYKYNPQEIRKLLRKKPRVSFKNGIYKKNNEYKLSCLNKNLNSKKR